MEASCLLFQKIYVLFLRKRRRFFYFHFERKFSFMFQFGISFRWNKIKWNYFDLVHTSISKKLLKGILYAYFFLSEKKMEIWK